MFTSMVDTYIENAEEMVKLKGFSSAVLEGFGMYMELMNSYEGWMAGQPHVFFILLLGSFAAIWAGGSITKERDRQTGEFLFTLPYSRGSIFASKAAAHWIQITVIFIMNLVIVYGCGFIFSTINNGMHLFLLAISSYLVILAFAGIGYIVTVFLTSERASLSVGIGIVLLSFLLNMLSGLSESMNGLSKVSLFSIFNTKDILTETSLPWQAALITLLIYLGGFAIGSGVLKRQDI